MTDVTIRVAIADPSTIIRNGLSVLLKKIQGYHVHTFEVHSLELVISNLRTYKPDILIINPIYWGLIDLEKIKQDSGLSNLRTFAFISGYIDEKLRTNYDDLVDLFDEATTIKQKFDKIYGPVFDELDDSQTLSNREKDIIIGVVKGLTNKEIATLHFLSTHTVITHRRNIARKLDIHSTAGLTIYAIVNKLVELTDLNHK